MVIPYRDASTTLTACVHSVLAQTLQAIEVLLVDDGADAASGEVADRLAAEDPRVRVLRRPAAGVAAARNSGAAEARGTFLAFCDADDTVPLSSYERLVGALRQSGSDLAVGSLSLQEKGRHRTPTWTRTSNGARQLGMTLGTAPETVANHYVGCRVFRRSFWVDQGLRFDTTSDYADAITMVRALQLAASFDVVPAVVYHWHRRIDERSLVQLAQRESARGVERVRRLGQAGALLQASEDQRASTAFFISVLDSVVGELVRSAMAQDDPYWTALSAETRRLTDLIPADVWTQVPFEDRVLAWLCSRGHRVAAEEFLEYSVDNPTGYPVELLDGVPHVALPVIDDLVDSTSQLTSLADGDLRYRTRLTAARWSSPTELELDGIAFVEYATACFEDPVTRIVLVDRATGLERSFGTRSYDHDEVNLWASRAHEDHANAAFRSVLDVSMLEAPSSGGRVFDVLVEHTAGPRTWRSSFHSRQFEAAAGLLEPQLCSGVVATPQWRRHVGLSLRTEAAPRAGDVVTETPAVVPDAGADLPAEAFELSAEEDWLVVRCRLPAGESGAAMALHGPRSRTPWMPVQSCADGAQICRVPLTQTDWGQRVGPLPADPYVLLWRGDDGVEQQVACGRALWRRLPLRLEAGDVHVRPKADWSGALVVRVWPVEWATSRSPYDRRRLRDAVYPAAREQPLLDVVLFETFAGKAAGDNPGAVCEELAAREEELELVYSVVDRSVEVPEGARAVVRFSREYFELLGRARYLVVNASLPYFFRKREGQLYFQTWHGTPLKRIAHDRPHLDFLNWHHRRQLLHARDGWDYLLSQSEFCSRALSSAFCYSGPVMEVGYPRNDVLVSSNREAVRRTTRERLGLDDDAYVVLYAPTWRDNLRVGRVFDKVLHLEPERLVRDLDRCVVLVRGHYNSVKAAEQVDPDRRIIDVTRYPDIAHLYLAADALVTDYSSVFFDFALVDKPMAFLAPDLVAYRDDNRGFYLDYHTTVPGPVCETTEEIVAVLSGDDNFAGRRREFRERFAPLDDGHAAERVVDAILDGHPYR